MPTAPETYLLTALADPLLTANLYGHPLGRILAASVMQTTPPGIGACSVNRNYAAGTAAIFYPEEQRHSASILTGYLLGASVSPADLQTYGTNGIEYCLGLQIPGTSAGVFQGSNDLHSCGLWLHYFGETCLAGRHAATGQALDAGTQARYEAQFLAAVQWYYAYVSRLQAHNDHRVWYTAGLFLMAACLTDGDTRQTWINRALPYVTLAISQQDAAGWYGEYSYAGIHQGTVGPDVSYNCTSIYEAAKVYLLLCGLGVVDSRVAQVRTSLSLACDWERTRQYADGTFDITNSWRIGPQGETTHAGAYKTMDNVEAAFAYCLAAYVTGRASDYASAALTLHRTYNLAPPYPAFAGMPPSPPGGVSLPVRRALADALSFSREGFGPRL